MKEKGRRKEGGVTRFSVYVLPVQAGSLKEQLEGSALRASTALGLNVRHVKGS
jgi:hypothetical protein